MDLQSVHVPRLGDGGEEMRSAPSSLQEMIDDEIKGSNEYSEVAGRATDPDIKSQFLSMSQDELRHAEMLTAMMMKQPMPPVAPIEAGIGKSLTIDIAKVQGNVIYGVVLHANKPDLQGDIMHPDDIRKAMHEFMEEFRTINKDHADDINACPVECWQAKDPGMLGNSKFDIGDWLMGTKINDPAMLSAVLEGKYKSYSIEGVGTREPIPDVSPANN